MNPFEPDCRCLPFDHMLLTGYCPCTQVDRICQVIGSEAKPDITSMK
jgi:hypothetical protein